MGKDKQKRPPRRFMCLNKRILGLIVIGIVVLLKRDAIQFRLHNLLDPVYGEIIFHSDPDGDGLPQLYHMIFNTAFRYSHVEPLTDFPAGAHNGVYSPDGEKIAFESGDSIFIMESHRSSHIRHLTQGHNPVWLKPDQIVFQRVIGRYGTDMLQSCPVYAPFVFDLHTGSERPFYNFPDESVEDDQRPYTLLDNGFLAFRFYARGMACSYGDFIGQIFTPETSTVFRSFSQQFKEMGVFDQTSLIVSKRAVLSPSGRRLARAQVYAYRDRPSAIELYIDGEWQTIRPVHGAVVSWSPDERFLVYDGLHPDGTSVLALTSVDGTWVYPLIGNDGISYFSPNWRP